MKAIVLYESKTGNTQKMAEAIASGMRKVEGVEVKTCPIEAVDFEWARESKCIILGSPTYCANVSGSVKTFLEGPFRECAPVGKLGGAFATANYVHGGGDLGVTLILEHMLVFGMLIYSGGGAFGTPVVHLGPVAWSPHLEEFSEIFSLYGERMAGKALEIFGK